ncbi:hypothetical protein Vadar_016947 [Vaccinium darrowii]|uniref:Uncharacterized protein n=1 Tax=Vaccinium darrowii TaxID=229202 RepID=A0ACB7YX58_9ERIC|nr:hypothetical protein Vadar_016947 [Vaccinium darrowii]
MVRRRRRRRSPLRRKEKRSRSRSWSPKKQRSRSKSPTYRRGTESSGDKMRRDKSQLPQCFDFLRGRCYRGAFCRYMHHESENTDGGRHYRSKQQDAEVPPVSGTSGSLEEIEKSLDKGKVLVPVQQSVQTVVSHQEDESLDIAVAKSDRSGEVTTIMHETQGSKEEILEPTTEILDEENCAAIVDTVDPLDGSPSSHGVESSKENLVTPQSQASLPVLQNAYNQPSDVGDSSMSGSFLIQTSSTFQNQPPVSAPRLDEISPIQSYNGFSSQTLPPKELHPLVIPFPPSLSQGTVAPPPPQQPGETMQPPSNFPTFYPPMENCPPNQVQLQNQHSYFHAPPNSSWSLPPPPPLPPRPLFVDHSTGTSATAAQGYHWLQLQQNQLPPRPSSHMEDFKLNPPPMVNTTSQPFGGPSLAQGNMSLQHAPSMRNSSSFQNYPQMQPQQPLYGLQQRGADIHTVNLGDYGNNNSTMTRSTDLIDRNQVSNLSGFGGSRISNHYNPYASTFDLPLTSKFSSNVLKQEKDRALFDGSYILSHVRPDGPGDQYDPLFDSIEPSSNSSKKLVHDKRRETTLSCSGSHKPLDVEENNKRKEVEAFAITTSIKSENDECGETADAEVGDVDNASASNDVDNASARNLLDEGNTAVGEIEIDQIKTPGKRKKSKDSRSMKHFKVALANFVKEELKSYWRQGILSKEAFKIIVKKIVDKVSGAMKSHHVPKSQSKINHYIDSSQRKLSKLVQGYLNKYAKG